MTVQDVDHVSSGRWIRGDGQDLGDPIGEDLVRRCQMPGLSRKKRYGKVDRRGDLVVYLLDAGRW